MRNLFLLSLGLLVSGMAGAQSTYSPWSLEFYGSPQWSQYSNRSETATFLVAGAAEGEVFSFSTGLLVRRQLRPRWLLDAGLGLEWKVASRWSLLFEPEGQLRLRANTGGQRRYRWGTRLGLVLYFGRS